MTGCISIERLLRTLAFCRGDEEAARCESGFLEDALVILQVARFKTDPNKFAQRGAIAHNTKVEGQVKPRELMNIEQTRLQEARNADAPWRKRGPYLSERQWGTVREDYSGNGDAWNYFSHEQARSRAYHWGEDGLAGISTNWSTRTVAGAVLNFSTSCSTPEFLTSTVISTCS